MLNLSFNLKDPQTGADAANTKETPIICIIRYNAQRIKYYTGERIHPKYWENRKENKNYQRVKTSMTGAPEFNRRLENLLSAIKDLFRKYQNENSGTIPTPGMLKALLDKEFNKGVEAPKTFMLFFEEIIRLSKAGIRLNPKTGKPISSGTVKTYVTTFNHLTSFQLTQKEPINFDTIDLEFYHNYKEFLVSGQKIEGKTGRAAPLNLSTNAIAKHFQIIKLIMNEAVDRGLTANIAHKSARFAVIREKSDSIYLDKNEIKELEQLDLSANKKLERVRDLFLIGYYTGQRFSDYSIIKPEKITVDEEGDEFLEITQVKTGNTIQIPIHSNLKKIFAKYEGKLPRVYAIQKMNEYLKDLGKELPCLHKKIEITLPTKGNMRTSATLPKYELLTTHTARRSFATNHYLAEWSIYTIMSITGHSTEKAFKSYIKLSSKEHAKVAMKAWKATEKALLRAV